MTDTSRMPDPAEEPQGSEESYDGQDEPSYISDDQLPEDLRPTEDNPLAKPATDDDEGGAGISLGPDGPQG